MPTRFIETDRDRATFIRFVESHALPFSASVSRGGKRSVKQNKLQRLWLSEIAEQLGDQTPEEVRGYCKLTIGVPILRDENEDFRDKYDRIVRPLPYPQKLAIMMEPLDLPVTRIMTTKQHASYLDGIYRHFAEQGLALTDPDPFGLDQLIKESDPHPPSASDGGSGNGASSVSTLPSGAPAAPPSREPGGSTPTQADARAAGAKAKADGMSLKAMPDIYGDEPLRSAYVDGFESGVAEDREPGVDG